MAEQHLCNRPGRRGFEELGRDLTGRRVRASSTR